MLDCDWSSDVCSSDLRSRLRRDFDITLPRFDLMAQLERVPQGMKMGELSKRMMVTGGNVTGITDQLVAEGLVVREDNPKDRRAYIVKLTKEGRRVFRQWADEHEDWIIRLFEGLGEKERDQLYALLAQLKQHVVDLHPEG
jgi:DNA-binding MarR family transcriptional regulator